MKIKKTQVDILNEQLDIKFVRLKTSQGRGAGRTKKVTKITFIPCPSQPKIHKRVEIECESPNFNDIYIAIYDYLYENYRLSL